MPQRPVITNEAVNIESLEQCLKQGSSEHSGRHHECWSNQNWVQIKQETSKKFSTWQLHSALRALRWNSLGHGTPELRTGLCCWQGSPGPGTSWGSQECGDGVIGPWLAGWPGSVCPEPPPTFPAGPGLVGAARKGGLACSQRPGGICLN